MVVFRDAYDGSIAYDAAVRIFNKHNANAMNQNSKRLVSIIGALLAAVVALVVFFDLIQPEFTNIQNTKGQIAAENDIYQTESQAIAAAQKAIDAYRTQQGQAGGTLALVLPTSQDIAGAITQVFGLAQNNGIALQGVSISAPSVQLQAVTTGSSTSKVVKPLGSMSLQISGAGTYENFKNFIAGIETNIRIFDLKNVTLSQANQAGAVASAKDAMNFNLTVVTYYQTN